MFLFCDVAITLMLLNYSSFENIFLSHLIHNIKKFFTKCDVLFLYFFFSIFFRISFYRKIEFFSIITRKLGSKKLHVNGL